MYQLRRIFLTGQFEALIPEELHTLPIMFTHGAHPHAMSSPTAVGTGMENTFDLRNVIAFNHYESRNLSS